MNGTRLMSRFVEVPSIRQLLLVFLDVLVPRGLECLNPRFNLGQRTHTNQHVDHWFCAEAGNCRTPDMLDDGFSSREHDLENLTLFVKLPRPIRII
jgi:hypothetical protein